MKRRRKPEGTTVDTSADGTISAKTVEAGDDIEESGSSLKTAWLNLKDGLLKRFAWSHVKAIFYDYAESKLLSAKLDEMDQVSGDLSGLTTTAKGSLVSAVNELDGEVGDLSGLTTTAKGSLISAINEVDGNIGDLSGLTTTAKTNLVAAVNELNNNMNMIFSRFYFGFASNFEDAWNNSRLGKIEFYYIELEGGAPSPETGKNRWFLQQWREGSNMYGWQTAWSFGNGIWKRYKSVSSSFSEWEHIT